MELDSSVQNSSRTADMTKSIIDLPPEMLQSVLNYLTTDELLTCRQLNRNWNELSSQLLCHRTDKMLRFRFKNQLFMRNIRIKRCDDGSICPDLMGSNCPDRYEFNTKSLTDLLNCFKDCKRLPYTSFDFGDLADFGNDDKKRFLSTWGEHIFCLKIAMPDPVKSVETLKKLLLEQIPNLKKLEIEYHGGHKLASSVSVKYSTAIPQAFQNIQLPKLEVLVVCSCYRKFRGIVETILTAACNLKTFVYNAIHSGGSIVPGFQRHLITPDGITVDDLMMLQSLNKLQCLQAIEIDISKDLIAYWKKSAKNLDLKPRTIILRFKDIWENQKLKLEAASIVNQLLESSKEVLETLAMEPMGLLPGATFPKLEKLHTLDLWPISSYVGSIKSTMFPQSVEMAEVFPNLKELGTNFLFDIDDHFPQTLTPMPSIEVLRMYDFEPIQKLMKMTPNVKTLLLDKIGREEEDDGECMVKGFRAIVNNLTKLETFGWIITRITYHQLLYKLDAAMTGLPEDVCEKMSVKYRNKEKLSATELASIEPQRRHLSILDLKELKEMHVSFIFHVRLEANESQMCNSNSQGEYEAGTDDEGGYYPNSDFYRTGFTKVSEFLAFNLMPNLKVRTHKSN